MQYGHTTLIQFLKFCVQIALNLLHYLTFELLLTTDSIKILIF